MNEPGQKAGRGDARGFSGRARRVQVWAYGVVLLLPVALYLNTLFNGFVFDDLDVVVDYVKYLKRLLPAHAAGHSAFGPPVAPSHRVLRNLSYALDYAIGGSKPTVFHVSNILYHALTTLVVFRIVERLSGAFRAALLSALVFAAHPIQTEAVAYISGRRDILSTLFYLLGLLAFIRYRQSGRRWRLGAAGGAYLLALLSKEMAITLPLMWLTYDLLRRLESRPGEPVGALLRRAGTSLARILRESWLFYLACFVAAGAASLYILLVDTQTSRPTVFWGGSLGMTLLTSARIIVHYIKLLLFPATLNADYSYNAFPVTSSWADLRAWLALCVLAFIALGLMRLASSCKVAAFGGIWFFVTLLPVSQIIPHHELMAEHYLYLPSVGVALLAGALLDRWARTARAARTFAIGFSAALLLLGLRTVVRNRDWKDNFTLWSKTVRTVPACVRARHNLSAELFRRGDLVAARRELETVLQLNPNFAAAHHILAQIAEQEQRYDDARRGYETALRLAPTYLGSRVSLAKLAILTDQLDHARAYLEETLRIKPDHPTARYYLGVIYEKKGELAAARGQFELVIRSDPEYASAYRRLGIIAAKQGDLATAAGAFDTLVRLLPESANDHYNLALVYQQQGWVLGARQHYETAVRLRPSLARRSGSGSGMSLEVDEERGNR